MDKPAALFPFHLNPTMALPWAAAGYDCYLIDLQHAKGERRDGNLVYVGADIHRWTPALRRYHFGFACPPCTDVAVSGARWFKGKGLYALAAAIECFARAADMLEAAECPYGIENPVSTISSYWRKPDHSFDPNEYAGYEGGQDDTYTKKTCIWAGGGFVMPPRKPLPAIDGSRMHLLPPSSERANLRSATPPGFANAVFLHNAREARRKAA